MMDTAKTFSFGDFELDAERRLLLKQGKSVALNAKAFNLLLILVQHRGHVLGKDELMEKVWAGQFVEENNLAVHVSALRKIFGERKDEHRFIVTVPGEGYSFVAELNLESNGEIVVQSHSLSRIIVEEETTENGILDKSENAAIKYAESPSAPSWVSQKRGFLVALSVLILAGAGLGYWFLVDNPTNSVSIESIAVMPFVNESGNDDVEYLSDGMTETVIADLSNVPGLGVKPRSSVFRYKGKEVTAKTVGAELNVQAVLFGRFIQRGDDLMLFLSLIETQSGNQIWGKQYVRKFNNLLVLQSEIARDISENLGSKLSGTERQKPAKNYTENVEAYNLYLQGRFWWNKFTGDSIRIAIRYFEQAIEKDRNYALAYTGLANSYTVLGVNGHMPVIDARPKARSAAETAIALDDKSAEAYLALGANKLFFDWDSEGAERAFRLAMELDPGYAYPHQLYSYVLRSQGRFDEAITEAKKAHELDPLDLVIYSDIGSGYRLSGRAAEAVEVNNKIIEMDPNFADIRFENALAHSQMGNYEIALEEIKRGLALSENSTHIKAGLGIVYGRAGKRANAQKVIDELIAESGQRYVSPLDIALIYSVMGERDKAFDWIEKAFKERTPWLIELNVNPEWEPIRADPRFEELKRRAGL